MEAPCTVFTRTPGKKNALHGDESVVSFASTLPSQELSS
jgi:hypothetical protein